MARRLRGRAVELSTWRRRPVCEPTAATVLNVSENHLDRYTGMDDYAAAKGRVFSAGGEQVLNRDDPRSLAMRVTDRPIQTFGASSPPTAQDWGLVAHDGALWLAHGTTLLLRTSELALVGRHNALNALAALALTSSVATIDANVLAALACVSRLAASHGTRGGNRRTCSS